MISCERNKLETLEKEIGTGKEMNVQKVASICSELGEEAANKIRNAATTCNHNSILIPLLQSLLKCDVNAHLGFAIEELAKSKAWYGPVLEVLMGQLDEHAAEIIEGYVRHSNGREFEVAANIYGMICDSPSALELAKERLRETDVDDRDETVGAIVLLGRAAYLTCDDSAADLLIPYLENSPYQLTARMVLSGMPGARAEKLFIDYARRMPGALTENVIDELLRKRREQLDVKDGRAIGWKPDLRK